MERPKVRFSQCQTPNIPPDQRETETAKDPTSRGKVMIKSIVPTNFPIRILEDGKRVLVTNPKFSSTIADQNQIHNNNQIHPCLHNASQSMDDSESRNSSFNFELESSCDQIPTKRQASTNESVGSLIELQECIDGLGKMSVNDSAEKSTQQSQSGENNAGYGENLEKMTNIQPALSNIPCITCGDTSEEDSDIEVIKIVNTSGQSNPKTKKKSYNEKLASKGNIKNSELDSKYLTKKVDKFTNKGVKLKTSQKADKENHFHLNKPLKRTDDDISPKKTKIFRDKTNPSSKISGNMKSKKPFKKNQQKTWVRPPSKFKEDHMVEKFPHNQVKKSTVFNVERKKSQVIVEVESAISKCDGVHIDRARINEDKKIVSSMDLLSRPEYNSTINVAKKLKELQAEKSNYNLENLPDIYKSLIHNKVSTALEFGPYETVYKDLISLTVDENQLPPRLMRSKDPEPRDRDIMPGLSDFYHPKVTRQYLTVAHPTTPCPVSVNTLNAFTISNRIRTWKMSRNNF